MGRLGSGHPVPESGTPTTPMGARGTNAADSGHCYSPRRSRHQYRYGRRYGIRSTGTEERMRTRIRTARYGAPGIRAAIVGAMERSNPPAPVRGSTDAAEVDGAPALRDADEILARAEADAAAANEARERYRTQPMAVLEPDDRIAPLLAPGEGVVAVRRSAVLERREVASGRGGFDRPRGGPLPHDAPPGPGGPPDRVIRARGDRGGDAVRRPAAPGHAQRRGRVIWRRATTPVAGGDRGSARGSEGLIRVSGWRSGLSPAVDSAVRPPRGSSPPACAGSRRRASPRFAARS